MWYDCIEDNQWAGRFWKKGDTYDISTTPPANLFTLASDAGLRKINSTPLPAWQDQEQDWHIDEDVEFDGSVETGALSTDHIDFGLDYDCEAQEGRLCWNATEGTLSLGMPGGNVTLNVGQEMFVPRRVINNTDSDMTNGQLVYISSGSGNNAYVSLARADAKATAETTIAMLTEDIAKNDRGYATTFGLVRDVDTSAYTSGTVLYLDASTAGAYTDTVPTHPSYVVKIGQVFRQHASEGSILINIEEPVCACKIAGGDDAVWDDLRFPATRLRVGALNKPDFDYTELGLLFPQNDASEQVYIVGQIPHNYLSKSDISPHIHYVQSVATQPTFKIDYRIYDNNTAVPSAWTTISTADAGGNKGIFSYTSGNLTQIATFPDIDMASFTGFSSIIDIVLYRDDNDVTGDVLLKEFDIHYQIDSLGSRNEFNKG